MIIKKEEENLVGKATRFESTFFLIKLEIYVIPDSAEKA